MSDKNVVGSWLCKYKNMFGAPNTGIHASYGRVGGLAVVDVVCVIFAAAAAHLLLRWSFWNTFVCLVLIGILAHRAFCVRTTIDKLIFYE